jgi:2,4-dienoyl-CoA reductase-like NADH-dependent reductase (Old Yellow Enzyme family)
MTDANPLFQTLTLPCGVVIKNRIVKSAMSDSLGDGTGHPTDAQTNLYHRWALGGVAASIIGEVQGSPNFAEKPGNLVLDDHADLSRFKELAQAGAQNNSHLWLQLGHAGALSYGPTSIPKGPSALDLPGLKCAALGKDEIAALPGAFARTAKLAQMAGFGGVQIHAAHGFLISQFLSPLFNRRRDEYGGSIDNRMRLLLETINAVRTAVGPGFVVTIKLNATDQLDGGLSEDDALCVIGALDKTAIDLIDISGGTYFPGAKSASDRAGAGPYFLVFAKRARTRTTKPLMITGGFKTRDQAEAAMTSGAVDLIGLARALVLDPSLPNHWQQDRNADPIFPRFPHAPEGGITVWYTMGMTALAEGRELSQPRTDDLRQVLAAYDARDAKRTAVWQRHFRQ